MSFDTAEVFEAILEAKGTRTEYFDGESYSFRRLSKVDNRDIDKMANLWRYQRWAKKNRERQRAIGRAYYARLSPERKRELLRAKSQRIRADPKKHAKRLASWRAFRARQRAARRQEAAP